MYTYDPMKRRCVESGTGMSTPIAAIERWLADNPEPDLWYPCTGKFHLVVARYRAQKLLNRLYNETATGDDRRAHPRRSLRASTAPEKEND